jgi:hypothetical protein
VRVDTFAVKDGTFRDALARLSLLIKGLHLGIEEALRSDTTVNDQVRVSLNLHNNTVRQILDELCSRDIRYSWSQDGDTVNVYPSAVTNDPSYLLNRRLANVSVALTRPEDALSYLDKAFNHREQLAYSSVGGDSTYSAPWNTTFHDVTVRQFINRVAERMGPRSAWIFYGTTKERLFTFSNTGFRPSQSATAEQP